MRPKRKHKNNMELPTIGVGGSVPTASESAEIIQEVDKQISEYEATHPQKPKDESPTIEEPLNVKTDFTYLDKSYIDLAKKYLGIPEGRNPDVLEMSKSVISRIEQLNKIIEDLRKNSSRGFEQTYWSSENGLSWN